MKNAHNRGMQAGFTILEVLIVLAISAAILASAVLLVNGRQNQTEFTTSIHDVQAQIEGYINDAINGYYPNENNFTCGSSGTTGAQGTNQGCIFIGSAMQFAVQSTNPQQYAVYTVVGDDTNINQEVTSYQSANTRILTLSNGQPVSVTTGTLEDGLTVSSMLYCPNGTTSPTDVECRSAGAVAFLMNLASYSGGNLSSGAQHLYLVPLPVALHRDTGSDTASAITGYLDASTSPSADSFITSPPQGVYICFGSGTTNQSGLISLTAGSGQLATNLTITDGNTNCGLGT